MVAWIDVRADERRLVAPAAGLVAAAGAAVALVSSAADALFLARVGARHLGTMFALSSALLIGVLGVLGAIADRRDRGRLLIGVAWSAALILFGLAALLPHAPGVVAAGSLIGGKQLGAAIDLGFWVLVAERLDARQARRLVPLLVAAGGLGVVIGSFAVGPLAHAIGSAGVLTCAGGLFGVAALCAHRFAAVDAARPLAAGAALVSPRAKGPAAWRAGFDAVRHSPLASRLAIVVGVAGVFAPILYYLLGVAASAHFGDEADLAQFLGRYRGVVQAITLAVQALIAPALLARFGVAMALVLAPVGAVVAAVALAIHPVLAVVVVAQGSARLLDTAVDNPAEKLAQNLLSRRVRGRVAGFLDGVAKRAGAIAGGLLASTLVVWPNVLAATTVVVAAAWLVSALALRRRFAELAVAELLEHRGERGTESWAGALVDERSLERLRRSLGSSTERQSLAIDLIVELGERGRVEVATELAGAALATRGPVRGRLLRALERWLADRPPVDAGGEALLEIARTDPDAERAGRAVRCLSLIAGGRELLDGVVRAELGSPFARGLSIALARAGGQRAVLDERIDEALGDPKLRPLALDELGLELAIAARAEPLDTERSMDRCRAMVRALRRHRGRGAERALAQVARIIERAEVEAPGAELVLLRADARELCLRICEERDTLRDRLRAAAVELLGRLRDAESIAAVTRALGDRDDEVRRRAADALEAMGSAALEALLQAASYGRRQARNAALEVLRDLRVTSAALDDVVEAELVEIDRTTARMAPLAELEGAPVLERLVERNDEAARTLFLTIEARLAEPAVGMAARQLLRARDPHARARALEALDTVLPRQLATRVLPRLDEGPIGRRSAAASARLGRSPYTIDEAIEAELGGGDPIARALVVHALDAGGRASHRRSITAAAAAAALSLDPMTMLRRLEGDPAMEDDMPRSVETMMALSQIPIFSELSSRQLAELAEVVAWQTAAPGETIVAQGDAGDAMYFVHSGRVRVEAHTGDLPRPLGTLDAGEPFGEMALFEGEPRSASVVAETRTRLGRIDRVAFEALVDEVPGIALAICRVLSRRVRKLNAAMTG